MPTPKEIYNQVKEAEAKIDQAQADFDVMEKRLGEIEDENPELNENALVEFRGFRLPRKEVRFIEDIERQTGELAIGDTSSAKSIQIENGRIKALSLYGTQIKELTQPLPAEIEEFSLSFTQIKELTQPLPVGLKQLHIRITPLATDPQCKDALEDLIQRAEKISGLSLRYK